MIKWIVGVLGTVVAGLLLAYSTNLLGLKGGSSPAPSGHSTAPAKVVMGALEIGTNRQGHDFDAYGKPAGNEQLCAEMCRADASCDAMTYVKSTGRCWLKNGVPPATADSDMVSAIKVQHPA